MSPSPHPSKVDVVWLVAGVVKAMLTLLRWEGPLSRHHQSPLGRGPAACRLVWKELRAWRPQEKRAPGRGRSRSLPPSQTCVGAHAAHTWFLHRYLLSCETSPFRGQGPLVCDTLIDSKQGHLTARCHQGRSCAGRQGLPSPSKVCFQLGGSSCRPSSWNCPCFSLGCDVNSMPVTFPRRA